MLLAILLTTGGAQLGITDVDLDEIIADGQTGIVITLSGNTVATGKRVTIDQGGLRRNQLVTAEDVGSITFNADLTGFTIPGSATLMVHVPR